jgi:hypothetical protein
MHSPGTETKRPQWAAAEITVCGSPDKETYEAKTQKTWYKSYPKRAAQLAALYYVFARLSLFADF